MKHQSELSELINQLKILFVYKSGFLFYNQKKQRKASTLLEQIATILKTFDSNIKSEKNNIRNELTIIDSSSHEKKELIDIDSIDSRVRNVLKDNNIFS